MVPAQSQSPVLAVAGVIKNYGARRVLDDVSFAVGRGERVALTGPSGSGKTTLLNCLGGVDRPDAGAITVRGAPVHALDSVALARLRRVEIGTIFQFFHLLPTLTAAENIEIPLQLIAVPAAERAVRVAAALDRVGLASRAEALPGQLSGGEQQRVAIARALIHRPGLVLADEPTGNLDRQTAEKVFGLMLELAQEQGTSFVIVTHDPQLAGRASRVLQLRDGVLGAAD